MRNNSAPRGGLAGPLERARFELLPTAGTRERVLEHLPVERALTITASGSRGLDATLDLACALAVAGYTVTPHLAARMVADRSHLVDVVDRLVGSGVRSVFVPGGDGEPVGDYADATALLRDLAELGSPFASVGITAYPESHPTISDDRTVQSMWEKRLLATEMVSNLAFDPDVVAAWLTRVRARGIELPLWLGTPGPTDPAKLLAVATRIGVGESTRFLLKHRRTLTRMLRPGGFRSEDFLRRLAPALTAPGADVAGLHVFTFNQLEQTEAWRARLLADLHATGLRRRARPDPRTRPPATRPETPPRATRSTT